jgi:Tetratricopeptide repeat
MFVLLALVFGVGFVFFGVGGNIPGTSLGDVFRDSSGTAGPSISSLEQRIQENPKDGDAYKQLAQRQQQEGQTKEAIQTLERYANVAPKDTAGLSQLGALYLLQANNFSRQAQAAQIQFAEVNPGAFIPSLTSTSHQRIRGVPDTVAGRPEPAGHPGSDRGAPPGAAEPGGSGRVGRRLDWARRCGDLRWTSASRPSRCRTAMSSP